MKKGHWYIVGVLAFSAVVLALVGVGVFLHEEPGLMEDVPVWSDDQIPLRLCVFSYAYRNADNFPGVRQDDLEKTAYVVGLINERLGFQAYTMSGGDDCTVLLTIGVPTESGWQEPGGSAELTGSQCHAVTANAHGEILTLTIYHELGHCLGLAHDDFRLSIMYPEQTETPDRALPPWISDSDRRLLREMYGTR